MKIMDDIKLKQQKKKEYKETMDYLWDVGVDITFTYKGISCAICPSQKHYTLVYNGDGINVYTLEEVQKTKIFDGKCLDEIYQDVEWD
ncbi:MAG: hypothetical protein KGV43_02415 [Arcobacter sp.]|nr:hypothetical protein [Arcobacter sp.]